MVGDLIGLIAAGAQHLLGHVIEGRSGVGIRRRPPAAAHRPAEGGPGFDGQLIGREVLGPEGRGGLQLRRPGPGRLARPGVDQIQRQAREGGAGDGGGADPLSCGVVAAEEGQGLVVDRLQAQRQPVHTGVGEGGEAAGLRVGRIGLQRHLEGPLRRPEAPGHGDDRLGPVGRHQRGGAAAEIDRDQPARPGQGAVALQVGQDRPGQHRLLIGMAAVAHHVEVAIGADAGAVGPMDIDRQRRRFGSPRAGRRPHGGPGGTSGQNSAAFSFSNARARWLMRSLMSLLSSPKVWS